MLKEMREEPETMRAEESDAQIRAAADLMSAALLVPARFHSCCSLRLLLLIH